MKFRLKIILTLIIIPLLLFINTVAFSQSARVKASDNSYNQKIVAVVYDDSGSMSGNKHAYAKYAMQVLMATLDKNDKLKVFPLNANDFDVDLTSTDRNQVVATNASKLYASGSTPPTKISTAIDWLSKNGLNKNSSVDGKEFKLIIITDGVFDGGQNTSNTISSRMSGYIGLQTSFFGIGLSNANYRVDSLVSQNSSVKAYYADNAQAIVSEMQKITNSTTGRYKMQKGVTFDSSDKKVVYVDLNEYDFSIVSLGVLAQSNGASVKLKSIESNTSLNKSRECNLSSSNVGLYGYSVMLSPQNESTHAYLYKEKIKLVFETAPTDVLILLEPAIKLSSTLQYLDGSVWKDITEQEVNANLKAGQKVRTRYQLVDTNTNQNLTNILNDVELSVSYNGVVYGYDDEIQLIEGKNEVALSVSINISGAKYTLYNSWACDVDVDPKIFQVDTSVTENYDGDPNKVRIDYSISYDYAPVSQYELEGANKLFTFEMVELKDPSGNDVNYQSSVSGNTVSIIFYKETGKYGTYESVFKIVRNDNRKARFSKTSVEQGITDLTISNSNELSLTEFELRYNDKPFEFTVTEKEFPINFNSNLIGYSFKIDGVDLTNQVTLQNNVLTFTPNKDLPSILLDVSNKDVVFEVWSIKNPNIKATATTKLNVLKSVYTVEVINDDNTSVNIYDLENCQSKIYYKVSVDGHVFTKQELIDGLNDDLIKIDLKPFGWISLLPISTTTDIVNLNGEDLICLSFGTSWSSPLANLFASLIITGDKNLTVRCGNGIGEGVLNLTNVAFLSRLWRWIVILVSLYLIIHTLLWIAGFVIAKKLPKGALVQIRLNPDKPKLSASISSNLINTDVKSIILWHLKRYLPFKEFADQDSVTYFGVSLQILDRQAVMVHTKRRTIIKLDLDDDDVSNAIRKWRRNWEQYVDGTRPSIKITTKQLLRLVNDMDKEVKAGTIVGISEEYYATKNLKGRIDSIIFFKYIY